MDCNGTSQRQLMERHGFALSRTTGKSMRPILWGGEHCVVVAPIEGEPAVGDLLMFRQGTAGGEGRNVVHRLVEVRETGGEPLYITRGDNCVVSETVRRGEIIGRVTEVHRLTGFRLGHAIHARRFRVTDRAYRIYSRIWAATWPARRLWIAFRTRVARLRARMVSVFRKR